MIRPENNEGGFTIIVALILLLLLTIIGTTAINTSTTETMISSAEEVKRTTFYVAEAGVEHATAMLSSRFVTWNQLSAIPGGPSPTWTRALDGTQGVNAAATVASTGKWIDRFNSGARWIVNANMGNGYTYNVRVWNNADTPQTGSIPEQLDTDGLIVVGAIATGPRNSRAAVEVVLHGAINNSTSVAAYTAQAGAGAGKNYNAADVAAISGTNLGAIATNANLQ